MKNIIIRILETLFIRRKKWVIESIPYTMHYKNVRAVLTSTQWQKLAKHTHTKADFKCQQCGARAKSLECHERWFYDITNKTTSQNNTKLSTFTNKYGKTYTKQVKVGEMRLAELVSLCKLCHYSKHPKFAMTMKSWSYTKKHIKKIFNINSFQFYLFMSKDKRKMELLNKFDYKLDLTYLNKDEYKFLTDAVGRKFTKNENYYCKNKTKNI